MPRLVFPTAPDGWLIVDTRVTLGTAAFGTSVAAGVVPPTVPCQGVIDTGSNSTGVSAAVLQSIGAVPTVTRPTQGVGGISAVRMFTVTLFVCDASRPYLPALALTDLRVFELPTALDQDVLIGNDVLSKCRLLVDGPGGYFCLDY